MSRIGRSQESMGIHKNPPQPGEMEQMTESCMTSPVVPAAAVANGLDKHGVFPAARRTAGADGRVQRTDAVLQRRLRRGGLAATGDFTLP